MRHRFGITCSRKHKLTKSKRYKGELSGSFTVTLMTCPRLAFYIVLPFPASQTDENSSHASCFKSFLEPSSCLFSLLRNPRDSSITTRLRSANKITTPPQLYEKISDIQTFIFHALSQYQATWASKHLSYYFVWCFTLLSSA